MKLSPTNRQLCGAETDEDYYVKLAVESRPTPYGPPFYQCLLTAKSGLGCPKKCSSLSYRATCHGPQSPDTSPLPLGEILYFIDPPFSLSPVNSI